MAYDIVAFKLNKLLQYVIVLIQKNNCLKPFIVWYCINIRALFRTKLLPVTHDLVDTLMLTVKPIYKRSNDDQKWATKKHETPFALTFKAKLTISIVLEDLHFLPVHHSFLPV